MPADKTQIIKKLRDQIKANEKIVGVAAGSGLTAKYAAMGGADLILALNSGPFRLMGRSSLAGLLPFANSNQLVMEFATREIMPIIGGTPVIFGLCATDPTVDIETYIDLIRARGFAGINNYPTVGIIDGEYRNALEEQGFCYDSEVRAMEIASSKNLFTLAFVFDAAQAVKMLLAGADVICAHLGFTKGGMIGPKKAFSLEACVKMSNEIFQACDKIRPDVLKMFYGGSVISPVDVKYMYDNTTSMGYLGGSTFERIPSELAVITTTREFKLIGQSNGGARKRLDELNRHYSYVTIVKNYVSEYYMTSITFSNIANHLHVSRTYLSTLFKNDVGCTFPEYLNNFRINKALELIESSSMNLSEIAQSVGFGDYVHFSKVFKKRTGKPPMSYLKEARRT